METKLFETLEGFGEKLGDDLELELFIENKIFELFRLFGYQQIEVPIIEKKNFFVRKYVGDSPWPGWNKKCLFNVNVRNYLKNYRLGKKSEACVLIPEGTISVCRWVANRFANNKIIFPLKLYYLLSCFRNETIEDLSAKKKREFKQIGLELLGPNNDMADVEILYLISQSLKVIGVPKRHISIRLGDVRIFNRLIELSGISKRRELLIKELLDKLAEAKAVKKRGDIPKLQQKIKRYVEKNAPSFNIIRLWEKIYSAKKFSFEEMLRIISDDFKNPEVTSSFKSIGEMLNFLRVPFEIDLSVVRGQEYYTGPVFEIDILGKKQVYLEVAGGGRYDKLISRFLDDPKIKIPGTGFAFGLERLVNVLKNENYKIKRPVVRYLLNKIEYVLFPQHPKSAWKTAEKMRKDWKRVNLYLLDNDKINGQKYAKKKRARFMEV